MATAARRHAFRILLALEQAGPTLPDLLAHDEVESLPGRDRAFLHELLLGTLRHRGALDHALAPLVHYTLIIEPVSASGLAAALLGALKAVFDETYLIGTLVLFGVLWVEVRHQANAALAGTEAAAA